VKQQFFREQCRTVSGRTVHRPDPWEGRSKVVEAPVGPSDLLGSVGPSDLLGRVGPRGSGGSVRVRWVRWFRWSVRVRRVRWVREGPEGP